MKRISRMHQTRKGRPGRMGSPRRGDPVSTESAFEGIPRENATIVARFLHCGSCQKVGCRAGGRVQPAHAMTSKSVSANIRKASVRINLPSREKSYLSGERRKRSPLRHCQYAENAAWMRFYLLDENKFCAWVLFGQRAQPICER
jgi:hypothetical protein